MTTNNETVFRVHPDIERRWQEAQKSQEEQPEDDKLVYEKIEMFQELAKKSRQEQPQRHLRDLPVSRIETMPELFQPRDGLNQNNIASMAKLLRDCGPKFHLGKILLWMAGSTPIVIDGHHRLEAYRRAGRKRVRVEIFQGTLEDAFLEADRRNSKIITPMNSLERLERAWHHVKMGLYSKALIAEATGIATHSP
jgi:hypothetical protein